jgi:hypothetical protein
VRQFSAWYAYMQEIGQHILINIHLHIKLNYTQVSYRRIDNSSSTLLEYKASLNLMTFVQHYKHTTSPFSPTKKLKGKINSLFSYSSLSSGFDPAKVISIHCSSSPLHGLLLFPNVQFLL